MIDGNMTILSVTKEDTGAYVCSVKNLLGEDSALAMITVIDRLKFTLAPPLKVAVSEFNNLMLNCKVQGALEITWKRTNKNLPQNHIFISNGSLFLKQVTPNDEGSYTCVARNYQRTIEASCVVEVLKTGSCSSIYKIRPQLAALTRISQNCEQFIKFECNKGVGFVQESVAWWTSRDGMKINYWGGAGGSANMCACGVTNSCSSGKKCNCYNGGSGWREDSGLLTDKSALPVSQIRLSDLNDPGEQGYHTLGKLKCYGLA